MLIGRNNNIPNKSNKNNKNMPINPATNKVTFVNLNLQTKKNSSAKALNNIKKSSISTNSYYNSSDKQIITFEDFTYFAKIFEDCLKVPDMPYKPTEAMLKQYFTHVDPAISEKWIPFLVDNHYLLYLFQMLNILAHYDSVNVNGIVTLKSLKEKEIGWSLKWIVDLIPEPTTIEAIHKILYKFMVEKSITPVKSYNTDHDKLHYINMHGNDTSDFFRVPDNMIICFQTPINKYSAVSTSTNIDLDIIIKHLIKYYKTAFLNNPKNFLNNFECTSNFTYYYPGQLVPELILSRDANWNALTIYHIDIDPIIKKNIEHFKLSEYIKRDDAKNSFIMLTTCRRCSISILPPYTELFYRSEYFYTIFNNTFLYKLHKLKKDEFVKTLIICNQYLSHELIYSKDNRDYTPQKQTNAYKLFYDPGLTININNLMSIQRLSIYYFHKPNIKIIESIIKNILDYYFNKFNIQLDETNLNSDKLNIISSIKLCVSNIAGKFTSIIQYYIHNAMFDELELIAQFILKYRYIPPNTKLKVIIPLIKEDNNTIRSFKPDHISIHVKLSKNIYIKSFIKHNNYNININMEEIVSEIEKKYPYTFKLISESDSFNNSKT